MKPLEEGTKATRMQLVAPPSWFAKIDRYRRQQEEIPTVSAAIRDLVEKGLVAELEAPSRVTHTKGMALPLPVFDVGDEIQVIVKPTQASNNRYEQVQGECFIRIGTEDNFRFAVLWVRNRSFYTRVFSVPSDAIFGIVCLQRNSFELREARSSARSGLGPAPVLMETDLELEGTQKHGPRGLKHAL